jgi:hypothetical protein
MKDAVAMGFFSGIAIARFRKPSLTPARLLGERFGQCPMRRNEVGKL